MGVSNKTVSKWENGAGLPDITVLPALAELYGVTADDILAGETLRGRPAEAQGPARRRLLLLRLRTRFDLCFIGSLALGVLAAFRVAYVSLAPGRCRWASYGSAMCWLSIRPGTVIYRWMLKFGKTCTASCWPPPPSSGGPCCGWCGWAGWRWTLRRCGTTTPCKPGSRCSSPWGWRCCAPCWSGPCAAGRGRMPLCCGYRSGCGQCSTGAAASCGGPGGSGWCGWRGRYFWRGCGSWADGQLDRVLAPWIARYGEELVQSGFPESWTILRGRLEADVALWLRLRQGVLIAGAVSGAGVLVWTLLHWKKRRPPLAEEGET